MPDRSASSELTERFEAADQLLHAERDLWAPVPFKSARLAWEDDHPELASALRAMDESELLAAEQSPARARRIMARWLPTIADRVARLEPKALERRPVEIDEGLAASVPARKWRQINCFASTIPDIHLPVLEWCSGKGHLGRILHHVIDQPVRCLERDERLTHAGRDMAAERKVPVFFTRLDALSAAAGDLVERDQLAVALHACGELHNRLIAHAIHKETSALAISPCCFHLAPGINFQPLSVAGRAAELHLSRQECRLAIQETVLAKPAVHRRRLALQQWRQGFDLWQREARGIDEYLPVPPVADSLYKQGFAAFMAWAAETKGIAPPPAHRLDGLAAEGEQRQAAARRLTLLRHLFRRPLEVWIVLDRALALADAGYQVEMGTFCDRSITPRNLMIRATRT